MQYILLQNFNLQYIVLQNFNLQYIVLQNLICNILYCKFLFAIYCIANFYLQYISIKNCKITGMIFDIYTQLLFKLFE